jgi:eukaryotic-like serine/threonine-protein kinase
MSSDPQHKKAPPRPPPRRAAAAEAAAPLPLASSRGAMSPARGVEAITLPRAELDESSPPSTQGKLRVVTVSPGSELVDVSQVKRKADPYLGCIIDARYSVEAVLGEGGMGVVYRCRHRVIGKKVAMKVLRADLARDQEVTERFLNEAKAASAIGNAHIIDISDFGQLPDGSTYFVMEFLDGIPLSQVVEGGESVPVTRILDIARQLAEGLAAAHRANIVHRDLKPDNIYLVERGASKDFVKILDFGIAKVSTAEGKLTRAGQVFGTPHYMSPEQAAGAPVDHRGDIYSLGVILYELASGKVPFDADNFMGILTQHMYKAPVPIRALVPQPQDVPPGLEAIVLKCLSKRPEQRYQSMDEVIGDIDKLKDGLIPDAVPEMMQRSGGFNVPADYFKPGGKMPAPVPATPFGMPRTRSRLPLYAGMAGVATAVGIVVAIFAKSASSPAAPEPAPVVMPAPKATSEPLIQPAVTQIVVAVEPLDAHVFDGDQDLGKSPVLLELELDATRTLEIRRDGYKSQTITIDASESRRSIKLEELKAARPGSGRPPSTRPVPVPEKPKTKLKGQLGSGDIVNPWGE